MNNTEMALEDLKHWDESYFTELKEVMRDLEYYEDGRKL